MKLLNSELNILIVLIQNEGLDIKKSSARRRFLRIVSPFAEDYNALIKDVNAKYALKKDDKPIIIDDVYQFDAEGMKKRRKEVDNLRDQEIEINIDSNKADVGVISGIVKDILKRITKDKMIDADYAVVETLENILKKLK